MFSAACEKWTIVICSMERSSCISFIEDDFKEATHFSPLPVNLGKVKNNLLDFVCVDLHGFLNKKPFA